MILTLAMVMSLCVAPASAAGSGVTITIMPDNATVDTTTGDAVVTYTVKAKVTDPALKVGSLTITLDPGAGLTLADKDEDTDSAFYYQENVALKYDKTYNKAGIFGAELSYAPLTKTFVAVGTTQDRNLNSTHGEVVLMTIMGKIAKGTTGSVTLKTTQHSYGDPSGASASVDCDVTPATVTITKAPIASVSFTLADPAQGAALPSLSGLGIGYTGDVEWYEGNSATGTVVTSNAKPNQVYTAKVTLTAKTADGESFADSVTIPDGYTKDSSSTSSKLVLTKTFPETGSLPAASVTDAPKANTGLKYNGAEQVLLGFKGNASGGTMQYSLDNSSWSADIPKGKDAKTYTVYYMAKGDGSSHSDSAVANISVKIDPKDISTATIGTIADQSYTGSAITPDLEVKDGTATLTQGKDYTVFCTDTKVGSATLTINGKGNYTGTNTANFNIVAADQNPTFTTPVNLAKGGQLDLSTLVDGAKGAVTFAIPPANPSATLSGNTLTATGVTGEVKVSVYITEKDVDGDGNNEYKAFSKSEAITVNVIAKPQASVTTAPKAVENLKYTGDEQELVTKGAASGGTMQYSLGSSPWSTEIPTAKDAGTYTVEYKVVGDDDHTDYTPTSNTVSVTIGPKVLQSSDLEQSGGSATKVYDSNANSGITVRVKASSLCGTDTLPINGSAVYNSANVAEANQITFTPTAITTGNYTLAASEVLTITGAKITARDVTITSVTATNREYVKGNVNVTVSGGTVVNAILGDDVTVNTNHAEGTMADANAGTGKNVTVTGYALDGAAAGNYELKEQPTGVTVDITKATAPDLEDITLSQKYNVTAEQSKDIGRAGMPEDAGPLTYNVGPAIKTGSASVTSSMTDSTVKFTITGGTKGEIITLPVTIESTNYADATANVVITLTKPSYSGGTSYAITVEKAENGTVSADRGSASKGSTVTITVKPDKGYELDALKVLDKNGDKVKLTEKNGKYTFTMPAGKVTVKGSFVEEVLFDDVKVGDYFYEAVKWAVKKDITNGVGNDLFAPNQPCTRGQIVTFLWRAAGSPEAKAMSAFSDVADSAYYAKAVAWAVENGITGGTGNGKFSPDATCTRAQAVTFLYRAAGSPKVSGSAEFGDVATNAYYADAVAWAAKNGITGGIGGGLFGSDNDCTRAQIVTFLYRSVK